MRGLRSLRPLWLLLPLLAAGSVAFAAGPAGGSDAEVRRMIESLRPAAAPSAPPARSATPAARTDQAGRTRNLVIEPSTAPAAEAPAAGAPPSAAAAPAPGLSLAISFEPNSAQLRPESGDTLGALVAAMLSAELRQQRFVIEGHTDANGTPAQNLRLSRERAEQVRLYLTTLGVSGERLVAVGKGSTEPVNARDPRAAENRRVRVVALP